MIGDTSNTHPANLSAHSVESARRIRWPRLIAVLLCMFITAHLVIEKAVAQTPTERANQWELRHFGKVQSFTDFTDSWDPEVWALDFLLGPTAKPTMKSIIETIDKSLKGIKKAGACANKTIEKASYLTFMARKSDQVEGLQKEFIKLPGKLYGFAKDFWKYTGGRIKYDVKELLKDKSKDVILKDLPQKIG